MGRFFLKDIDNYDTVFVRDKAADFIFSGLLIDYELVASKNNFYPYGNSQEYKKITLYNKSELVQLSYLKDDVEILSSRIVLTEKTISFKCYFKY